VAPPESVDVRGMHIAVSIGVAMVIPMMGSPPERTTLARRAAQERSHELEPPRSLERAVGEVTMVKSRQSEDAREERDQSHSHGNPTDPPPRPTGRQDEGQ